MTTQYLHHVVLREAYPDIESKLHYSLDDETINNGLNKSPLVLSRIPGGQIIPASMLTLQEIGLEEGSELLASLSRLE